MTTTTDRAELFTDEQRVRATALDAARAVLAKTGFASGELNVPTSDLIDVAEYIITGVHPLAGFGEATPAVLTTVVNVAEQERCEGCASTEITAHDSEGVPLCFSCDKADRDEQAEEVAARADD